MGGQLLVLGDESGFDAEARFDGERHLAAFYDRLTCEESELHAADGHRSLIAVVGPVGIESLWPDSSTTAATSW